MGKSNIFKRGYKVSREEAERQEALREKRKGQLWRLFLKDGEEVTVRFLTEEPINFYEHNVKHGNNYDSVICTGEDCPICEESGDRPQFKGAYLVWDYRKYKNRDGKTVKGTLRLYVAGTRIITQLDRLHTKYGLTNRDYTIGRSGSGTATTYMFDRGDEDKLTKTEIENMLPEAMKKKFDGTMESLYSIVEEALTASMEDVDTAPARTSYEDEDDDYDEEYDDNTFVDEEEDEDGEEDRPVRKSSTKRPSLAKKKSSAKSLFKNHR